jgi:3-isopropylmalate dehydrogenase
LLDSYKVGILPGEGIGREVVPAAAKVVDAAASVVGLKVEVPVLDIGWKAREKYGRILPRQTLDEMKSTVGWILGPLDAGKYPSDDPDFPTPGGKIRKLFDLYANVRPAKTIRGIKAMGEQVDLVVVRENTEGFYPDRNLFKGYGEFMPDEETVISLRVVTRKACRRIADYAFHLAAT